jgi:predicted dehydrogenase
MSESRQLRVGIVGLGVGRGHINAYNGHPSAEVVALCDANAELLARRAEEHGIERTFTDAEAFFRSGEVDVVSIATPNATHEPLTVAALEAGLHVLCEKPLAMNAEQAGRMLETARRCGGKLAVHYNHRMAANVQAMGRYREAGELGEVYFVRTVWHRRRGIPAKASFLRFDSAGGGCLIDLGVHIIDIALYLAGFPRVLAVSGQTWKRFDEKLVPHLEMEVDDFATAMIRCEGGAVISVEVSWASHHEHPEQMITAVYGTEAGLTRRVNHYTDTTVTKHATEHGNLVDTELKSMPGDVKTVQQDLIDAILEDREPACSGEHGLTLMRVLDALYQSSRENREIRLDEG